MKLEIRHLQLVDAITSEGSVTAAAERLHVTQSALSHQLREIESRLGTPLFLRVNRRLALAPAGERLLQSARRVLEELRTAEEDIGRLASHQDGVIRVSTECYTCYQWLPPLLAPFHRQYPGVDVEIVPDVTRRAVEALLARKIDLALTHHVRRDPRLRVTPVFDDELVVIVPRGHALASRDFVTASDLATEHLIMHAPAEESHFAKTLLREGVRPRRHSVVVLTEAIVELVRAGAGISAVPHWTVARHLRGGDLVALRYGRKGLLRKWGAATLKSDMRSEPLEVLIGLMRERGVGATAAGRRRDAGVPLEK
ncbi:MAG TPA: LysR substrate-binding domain-containing protein [Thermoanaerobaculia bacterium]|nr:LysR substrate-binding domain-containing protein [Thermoanaerobaculia bacterium]